MQEGLVTIVVPIFNVEKYLECCLERIAKQTYRNLEIILVDDGSPDGCPQICKKWATLDQRIKVIHKKNAGLGMARNTGIENATGEYICFFDSDDYIAQDTIEKCYAVARKECAEIVCFGFNLVDREGRVVDAVMPKTEKPAYRGSEVQESFLPDLIAADPATGVKTNLHMSAWAMMFSEALITRTGWRFVSEREIISEDVYSLLRLFRDVQCVAVLSEALYFYCDNSTSLTHAFRQDRYAKIQHFYHSILALCSDCEYKPEVRKRLVEPYLSFTIAALKQISVSAQTYKEKVLATRDIILDELLQQVLQDVKTNYYGMCRRVLFLSMRRRWYRCCYCLSSLQSRR